MAGTRNIIICLDGTKNEVKAKAVTNVFKVAEIADLTTPGEQVLYYGPGVGPMAAPGAWTSVAQRISLISGMLVCHGMRPTSRCAGSPTAQSSGGSVFVGSGT